MTSQEIVNFFSGTAVSTPSSYPPSNASYVQPAQIQLAQMQRVQREQERVQREQMRRVQRQGVQTQLEQTEMVGRQPAQMQRLRAQTQRPPPRASMAPSHVVRPPPVQPAPQFHVPSYQTHPVRPQQPVQISGMWYSMGVPNQPNAISHPRPMSLAGNTVRASSIIPGSSASGQPYMAPPVQRPVQSLAPRHSLFQTFPPASGVQIQQRPYNAPHGSFHHPTPQGSNMMPSGGVPPAHNGAVVGGGGQGLSQPRSSQTRVDEAKAAQAVNYNQQQLAQLAFLIKNANDLQTIKNLCDRLDSWTDNQMAHHPVYATRLMEAYWAIFIRSTQFGARYPLALISTANNYLSHWQEPMSNFIQKWTEILYPYLNDCDAPVVLNDPERVFLNGCYERQRGGQTRAPGTTPEKIPLRLRQLVQPFQTGATAVQVYFDMTPQEFEFIKRCAGGSSTVADDVRVWLTCARNGDKCRKLEWPLFLRSISCNRSPVNFERQIVGNITGKNEPADLSALVRVGRNGLVIQFNPEQIPQQAAYVYFLEFVVMVDEEGAKRQVQRLTMDAALQFVRSMLQPAEGVIPESDAIQLILNDPVNLQRVKIPVRGNRCRHLECVGISSYFAMSKLGKYTCSICKNYYFLNELKVDPFVEKLANEVPEGVGVVWVKPDGTWTVKDNENNGGGEGTEESPIIVLDEDGPTTLANEMPEGTDDGDDVKEKEEDSPPPPRKDDGSSSANPPKATGYVPNSPTWSDVGCSSANPPQVRLPRQAPVPHHSDFGPPRTAPAAEHSTASASNPVSQTGTRNTKDRSPTPPQSLVGASRSSYARALRPIRPSAAELNNSSTYNFDAPCPIADRPVDDVINLDDSSDDEEPEGGDKGKGGREKGKAKEVEKGAEAGVVAKRGREKGTGKEVEVEKEMGAKTGGVGGSEPGVASTGTALAVSEDEEDGTRKKRRVVHSAAVESPGPQSQLTVIEGTQFSTSPVENVEREAATLPDPLHILHIRETAPLGAWEACGKDVITMISKFFRFVGAVRLIDGVYARFEDKYALVIALGAVGTFIRVSEKALTVSANPDLPHAIEKMLRAGIPSSVLTYFHWESMNGEQIAAALEYMRREYDAAFARGSE